MEIKQQPNPSLVFKIINGMQYLKTLRSPFIKNRVTRREGESDFPHSSVSWIRVERTVVDRLLLRPLALLIVSGNPVP